MRNPKQTIAYLDELQTLGFTDEAFWRIHHFREKGEKESINGHRSYCEVTDSFLDEGTNERVQIRLLEKRSFDWRKPPTCWSHQINCRFPVDGVVLNAGRLCQSFRSH
jgi:hypothetical protein